jgi:hypothetical protein
MSAVVLLVLAVSGAAKDPAAEPTLRVVVDARVELVSILFRLAGNPEYSRGRVDSYTQDVEKHFSAFRDHPAVEAARKLRRTRGVSFDAPMSMAVLLTNTEKVETKVPLDPWPESLDSRWTADGAREFLEAARRFVRDASFRDFFEQHRPLYEIAESRMRAVLEKDGHLEWFGKFFGERPGASFTVVLGMLNGGNCYGPHCRTPDGKEELYCVLGVWKTDAQGRPEFYGEMLGTVIHEFCHSYTNAVVDRHAAELQAAGEKMYRYVAPAMGSQAYGNWKTMLYESLVRACVVRYTRQYAGEATIRRAVEEEKGRQFLWIGELSDLLGQYEAQRSQYATLEAFSPRIVKFFNEYADKFAKEQAALEARRPKVVSIIPADGATDVDPSLTKIVVVFDRPMRDRSWSMVGGGPNYPESAGKPSYDAKRTTWSIPVKLKPDWSYEFMLNAGRFTAFQSEEGVPLAPVRVTFKTAKKAQEAPSPPATPRSAPDKSPATPPSGARYALLICGHPGDKEHEEMYAEVMTKLREGLISRWRFPAENVAAWFGTAPTAGQGQGAGRDWIRGPSTRQAIQAGAEEARRKLKAEDTLWVIVVGHAHFDGRQAFFNLPGPDIDVEQFGRLWQGVGGREQVFWITTPVSGYAIKYLSQKGRVVITATEADREVNETIFPLVLADVLSSPPPPEEFDRDKDGRITLFDLYLTVSREVLRTYGEGKNIPTEHAQLDDNGDGRGSEVQLDYLEEELGGRAKGDWRPKIKPGADGSLAAAIELGSWEVEKPQHETGPHGEPRTKKPESPIPGDAKPEGRSDEPAQKGDTLSSDFGM